MSALPQSNTEEPVLEASTKEATTIGDRLPPYMESMWHSITSSSQAVTSAMQTHIVPKIPLLGQILRDAKKNLQTK